MLVVVPRNGINGCRFIRCGRQRLLVSCSETWGWGERSERVCTNRSTLMTLSVPMNCMGGRLGSGLPELTDDATSWWRVLGGAPPQR